jgi:hypothetical protein
MESVREFCVIQKSRTPVGKETADVPALIGATLPIYLSRLLPNGIKCKYHNLNNEHRVTFKCYLLGFANDVFQELSRMKT